MWVIAYDANKKLRTAVPIAMGDHLSVTGHMPTLLGAVVASGSERFLIAHNHPAGSAAPSQGDIEMTLEVKRAAEHCGLWFEDSLIVAQGEPMFSFYHEGLLHVDEYGADEGHQGITASR